MRYCFAGRWSTATVVSPRACRGRAPGAATLRLPRSREEMVEPVVVFILSANRSGSTWLNLVLGSHSWAANVGELYRPFLFPSHVVCRLCEANGLARCTVLGGLEDVPAERAYHFAAERFGRGCVVDASKRLDWCARFVGRDDMSARLVHLVRHPAGYVASERIRRPHEPPGALFDEWRRINQEIEAFAARSGRPHVTVAYDDLADAPHDELPPLCRFAGGRFEPAALEYWRVEHHGLGANGAASLYLEGRKQRNWERSEDGFYARLKDEPQRSDTRWAERVDADECDRMLGDPYVARLRERIGTARRWARVADVRGS
jgi:hypothetical protein